MRFVSATVPHDTTIPEASFQQLSTAVAAGAAVELHYDLGAGQLTLVEGTSQLLGLVLQQTPPSWTESEPRTMVIVGAERQAWVMRNAEDEHWVIFELDNTLIVAHYHGGHLGEAVLSALARLVLLG